MGLIPKRDPFVQKGHSRGSLVQVFMPTTQLSKPCHRTGRVARCHSLSLPFQGCFTTRSALLDPLPGCSKPWVILGRFFMPGHTDPCTPRPAAEVEGSGWQYKKRPALGKLCHGSPPDFSQNFSAGARVWETLPELCSFSARASECGLASSASTSSVILRGDCQ